MSMPAHGHPSTPTPPALWSLLLSVYPPQRIGRRLAAQVLKTMSPVLSSVPTTPRIEPERGRPATKHPLTPALKAQATFRRLVPSA